jgi:RNA polymerase sigma-70 factor, ECF subfamily
VVRASPLGNPPKFQGAKEGNPAGGRVSEGRLEKSLALARPTLRATFTVGAAVSGESSERVPKADEGVFEALVLAHQDRIYDFCVRMLGDREEAFDVVQDIFIRVHGSLAEFRADATVTTWLFRIAKNHCLNRLKYLRRRRWSSLFFRGGSTDGEGPPLPELADDKVPADEALIVECERKLLSRAIAALETEPRLLVTLRDLEGLSYEEIVTITELPLGTVKSRLHRAREKLAKLLAQLAQEDGDS